MHLKVTEWHEGFVKRCSKDAFISRETGLARLFSLFLTQSLLSCVCGMHLLRLFSREKRKKNSAFLLCIKDARCILNAQIVNCTWIQFLNRKPEVQSHLSSLLPFFFLLALSLSTLHTLLFPLRSCTFQLHTKSVSRFEKVECKVQLDNKESQRTTSGKQTHRICMNWM